jgi:hypothetical protein
MSATLAAIDRDRLDTYGRASAESLIQFDVEIARLENIIVMKEHLATKALAMLATGVYLFGQYEFGGTTVLSRVCPQPVLAKSIHVKTHQNAVSQATGPGLWDQEKTLLASSAECRLQKRKEEDQQVARSHGGSPPGREREK